MGWVQASQLKVAWDEGRGFSGRSARLPRPLRGEPDECRFDLPIYVHAGGEIAEIGVIHAGAGYRSVPTKTAGWLEVRPFDSRWLELPANVTLLTRPCGESPPPALSLPPP